MSAAYTTRFLVIPTDAPTEDSNLFIIWDRKTEQVIDVMTEAEVARYNLEGEA